MSMVVRLNGRLSHIVYNTEPNVSEETSEGIIDWLNKLADKVVSTEIEFILKPVGSLFKDGIMNLIEVVNSYSVEIIVLGIVGCSVGMIVAPMLGSSSGRWFGRVVFVSLVGAVWRLVI